MAWVGLVEPTREELDDVAGEFGLPPEMVSGLSSTHRRPGTQTHWEHRFVALLTARYLDEPEQVEFGEIRVLAGPDFLLSARHGETSDLCRVRRDLEERPEVIARPAGGAARDPGAGRGRLRAGGRGSGG